MKRDEMIAACYATPTGRLGLDSVAGYPVNLLPTDPDLRTDALRLLVATGLLTEEDARMLRAAATPPHTASDF